MQIYTWAILGFLLLGAANLAFALVAALRRKTPAIRDLFLLLLCFNLRAAAGAGGVYASGQYGAVSFSPAFLWILEAADRLAAAGLLLCLSLLVSRAVQVRDNGGKARFILAGVFALLMILQLIFADPRAGDDIRWTFGFILLLILFYSAAFVPYTDLVPQRKKSKNSQARSPTIIHPTIVDPTLHKALKRAFVLSFFFIPGLGMEELRITIPRLVSPMDYSPLLYFFAPAHWLVMNCLALLYLIRRGKTVASNGANGAENPNGGNSE